MPTPNKKDLQAIVKTHFGSQSVEKFDRVIDAFVSQQTEHQLASLPTDQLLNLIYLLASRNEPLPDNLDELALKRLLFTPLTEISSRRG